MSGTISARRPRTQKIPIERLEERRLMSFVPVIDTNALTADNSNYGLSNTAANLVDPRAIAVAPNGNLWIADNGSGTVTTYNAVGVPQPSAAAPLAGTIPSTISGTQATPTGLVAHGGAGFDITVNHTVAPSTFLFATEQGTIGGYNPSADASEAVTVINDSSTGDVFKGLTIVGKGTGARIYATDFFNGRVVAFNSDFQPISFKAGSFTDPEVPAGYAPFGIQAIGSEIYVTYARQDSAMTADNPGPAQGIVDVYSEAGKLLHRVATGGDLNSPWAIVQAPSNWGVFKGDLLIGNDGDGSIDIFNKKDQFVEEIPDDLADGLPLQITGLWGLAAGTGKSRDTLFFTSAPNDFADGIIGTLTASRPAKI